MRKLIVAATTLTVLAMPAISMASVGHIAPTPTRSHTATTVYNDVTYVHKYTLTTNWLSHSFTGVNSADSPVGINESVSGTLNGSNITINGMYHDGSGYTWNYSGPLTGGTGIDSLGLKWNISFKKSWNYVKPASPITVTPYHVDNNDAEWGLYSCSGLHTVITGTHASTTDTFTCTSTTGKALTGLKPLQRVTLATVGGWGSDYSGTDGGSFWYGKTAKSLEGIVSLNGKSITAVATY